MAYSFQTNLLPTTGHDAMFAFKQTLVASGGSVVSSGTGSGGSYNASGDSIATSANLNATNAWFRYRFPTLGGVQRELIVQRTADSRTYRIKYSPGAGFSGAPGGGGSTDADTVPSATDERVVVGGGTDAAPTGTSILPTDGGYRFHVCAGGATELLTYWAAAIPNGGGSLSAGWFMEAMAANTYPAGDLDPYVMNFSTTPFNQTNWAGAVTNSILGSGIYKKGLSGEAFVSFSGCTWAGMGIGNSNLHAISTKIGSSPFNGKDDIWPLLWARRLAVGSSGYKGIGQMFRHTGVLRTVGDTLTLSTTRDRIVFGSIVLPWDGSVPVL